MCYEAQTTTEGTQLQGRNKDPIPVLGMVTLSDLDRLQAEAQTGRGWIACTTDAIFLEKPSYYDLLIDLTTSTPNKATRPTFHSSKPIAPPPSSAKVPTYRLSTIRFAWSDVKLVSNRGFSAMRHLISPDYPSPSGPRSNGYWVST